MSKIFRGDVPKGATMIGRREARRNGRFGAILGGANNYVYRPAADLLVAYAQIQ